MDALIVKILMGSHLYGCAMPESDKDYKEVRFQSLRELLISAPDTCKEDTRDKDNTETQSFSFRYFMKLLLGGQVIPMDMVFAPTEFVEKSSPTWQLIVSNRDKFISRQVAPFVGYAKSQAIKYGLKGSKINTLDTAISLLEMNTPFDTLMSNLTGLEGVEFATEKAAGGPIRHIIICGKSFGETTDYEFWLKPLRQMRISFGLRAQLAVDTGIDLKAQYHTVRICKEAVELLTTGNITFPRPEADLLLAIRKGDITKEELAVLVDDCFNELKLAESFTTLQEKPDYSLYQKLLCSEQAKYIAELL